MLQSIERNRPLDIVVLSLFFALGGLMCGVAAVMIYSSGGLHSIWRAVPAIATLGTQAVSWLLLVGIACFVVSLGVWRISSWGFSAASMLLTLGFIAHFWRAIATADWWRLLIVVTVGVVVGLYLRSRAAVFVYRES